MQNKNQYQSTITMTAFAKEIGVGRNRLYAFLREVNVLLSNNSPVNGYHDCFEKRISKNENLVYDVTALGQNKIKELVEEAGLDHVENSLKREKEQRRLEREERWKQNSI